MPPKSRVNKQMIVEAAFQVVRESGPEALNVRSVAGKLHCSTQPVMYNFKTIDEIKEEAYKMADEFHSGYIMPKGDKGVNPLLELGLNYIKFAQEEKNLFRFLFQANGFDGQNVSGLLSDPGAMELVKMVSARMDCDEEAAKSVFFTLFVSAHGIASLLANNAMEYEEDAFIKVLESAFRNVK